MDSEGADWQRRRAALASTWNITTSTRARACITRLKKWAPCAASAPTSRFNSATNTPPQNTRAKGRADVISQLIQRKWGRYLIDWDWVRVDKDRHLELRNPSTPTKPKPRRSPRR